jgi:2-keto-4-pentenoate hydratase/2-oxohepta-3-ene-1,7-dioic acid hydratase in catechol pathway
VPAVLDRSGRARDVSSIVSGFGPETLRPELIELFGSTDLTALPEIDPAAMRRAAPMATPRSIWCIGLNYSDHAAEAGMAVPAEPILFNKSSATFCGPDDPIYFAPTMTKLDWEVELGIVIGKSTLNVTRENALDHVLGYVLVNDVSERAWQLERGGQWVKGKSFPNFCPTGPFIVTKDEVGDPQNLALWLDVNGARKQTGHTSTMIFDVRTIVAYMSQFCRLEPGDLICTGTPPGVGAGMKPPEYLAVGDVVELGIDCLGTQRQTVVSLPENFA